jgi:hypothetical protein
VNRREPRDPRAPLELDPVLRWTALIVHVAIGVFPLSASGLLAPPWALVVVGLGWLAGLAAAWRIGKTRPRLTLLVPVVTVAAWFAFMTIGDIWLGWVA